MLELVGVGWRVHNGGREQEVRENKGVGLMKER